MDVIKLFTEIEKERENVPQGGPSLPGIVRAQPGGGTSVRLQASESLTPV